MVHCLTVAYRGTEYAGWQRQPNAIAVQQKLEESLGLVVGEAVTVVGAGRTDAGVHARGQVAHVVTPNLPDLPDQAFVHGTNRHLPSDIRVMGAWRMGDGFHARKSALSKVYSYRMVLTRWLSPLESLFAVEVDPTIDRSAMRDAAARLVGEHDFSAFASSGGAHTNPRRTILSAELVVDEDSLVFRVEGTGFLRGMVRALVGTILEVGMGKRAPGVLDELLRGASRSEAGPTAPARGLVLECVRYAGSQGGATNGSCVRLGPQSVQFPSFP